MTSLTKNPKPKTKKIFSLKTSRLAESFAQLFSAFGAGVMPVQSHVQIGCFHMHHLN